MAKKAPKSAYQHAGVDIDAGERFAAMIKQRVAAAWPEAGKEIGGFAGGGLVPHQHRHVVGSTDGPGTKIILAALVREFSGIGRDIVAMTAVDTFVDGAQPRFFYDYLAVGKLIPDLHIQIIDSLIAGCIDADCMLVGGETAEMPDLYRPLWKCDCAGFVIGFSRDKTERNIRPGMRIYGWPSYGIGSNGFSLVRRVFKLRGSITETRRNLDKRYNVLDGQPLSGVLLSPTPIWIRAIRKQLVPGMVHAHITGGGMPGNIPRILPPDCTAVIDRSTWQRPAIFHLIQTLGNVAPDEMDRVFNQGIMMVSIIPENGPGISDRAAIEIGTIEARDGDEPQVRLVGEYNDPHSTWRRH